MKLNDFSTYNFEDMQLECNWSFEVIDKPNNSYRLSSYSKPSDFDLYVTSVSIPFSAVEYEKTSFGMTNIKDRKFPDDVTIKFYDKSKNPWIKHFTRWKDSIYDFDNNCVYSNWRDQSKDFKIMQFSNKNSISNGVMSSKIEPTVTFWLRNCYIVQVDDFEFDVDSGSPREYSITLSCEDTTWIFHN